MLANPNVKIARPINSPRTARKTTRIKGKIQTSRSEFEDQETLAKEKNDIIREILALRNECDTLQAQVYDKETDFDEQQALEIQYLNSVDDKSGSEYKRRVLVYTKQVAQLESEMNDLTDKYTFLSTYFSEDSIFRLKNEIVYEKNSIGHQRDDLKAVLEVRDEAENELQSKNLATGIRMCQNQRSHLIQLKKELKEHQEKEKELDDEYQSTLVLPKKIEAQQKEIEELQKRLQNCQHAKFSKQRDINKKKEEVETEKSVMNNVQQRSNVQKKTKKERENFNSTMTGTRSSRIYGRNGRIIDVPAFRKSQRQQRQSEDSDEDSDNSEKSESGDLNTTGRSAKSDSSEKSKNSDKSENSDDEKKSDDSGSEKKSDDEDSDKKSDEEGDSDKKSDEDDDSDKKSDEDDDSDKKSDDDDDNDSDKKSDEDDDNDSDKKSDDDDDNDSDKKSDEDNDSDKNSDTDEMD